MAGFIDRVIDNFKKGYREQKASDAAKLTCESTNSDSLTITECRLVAVDYLAKFHEYWIDDELWKKLNHGYSIVNLDNNILRYPYLLEGFDPDIPLSDIEAKSHEMHCAIRNAISHHAEKYDYFMEGGDSSGSHDYLHTLRVSAKNGDVAAWIFLAENSAPMDENSIASYTLKCEYKDNIAAQAGYAPALFGVAQYYIESNNLKSALPFLFSAAMAGNPNAAYYFALCFIANEPSSKDLLDPSEQKLKNNIFPKATKAAEAFLRKVTQLNPPDFDGKVAKIKTLRLFAYGRKDKWLGNPPFIGSYWFNFKRAIEILSDESFISLSIKNGFEELREKYLIELKEQDEAEYARLKKADADKHLEEIFNAIQSGNSKWLNDHASLHPDFAPDQIAAVLWAAVLVDFETFKIIYDKGFRCGANLIAIVRMAFDLDRFEILDLLDKDGEDIKSINPKSYQGLLLWRNERSSTESI